ncbi:MAG: DNA primase [Betaproteobacteria bacterium]|nr:DNA primase [Betaproteobacteria bacterium]
MIPQPFIHDLLNRLDIVDTIDRHVPLKKAGANYVACCPFHSEKTPSFTVSQSKQFYHCFGCGVHGNAINFLIEYSGLSFVEAVKDLAEQMGMPVPEQQPEPDKGNTQYLSEEGQDDLERPSQDLFEVMKIATRFYREQLKVSDKAIAYLKKRGLTGETAARFAIGYAPANWQNLEMVFSDYKSASTQRMLLSAGLIVISDDGDKQYDRFRDRIMFPILNQKGLIVGFGGRVIEQEEPKYLNSPETKLFEKGRELYNFFSARRAIRDAGCVVVVEGYMDVVALSQYGVAYTVAALGTATTPFHIQKLLRQTDKIIFCFDGDQAGKKAAWRALENCLSQLADGKYVSFLFLPEGEDPDSYVSKFGKQAFEDQLKQATPLSEFLFMGLSRATDLQSSEGCAKLVRDIKPLLQQVKAPALALMLLKRLSQLSGISQTELEALLQIKRSFTKQRTQEFAPRKAPVTPYHWLILVLLYSPSYISKLDRDVLAACDENIEEVAALKSLIDFLDVHPNIVNSETTTSILIYLQDSPHRALLESVESETLEWDESIDLEAEFSGALMNLQEMQRKKRMTELHSKSLNMLTEEEKEELKRLVIS